MKKINKVAVIGAGTMGCGIASHLSNAGVEVILMDLVTPTGNDRSAIARNAVERLLKSSPPAFMHRDNATLITPANLQDDLHLLAQVDWIAEAVVERIDVKRALYRTINAHRRPGTFVSSNTSTLPLSMLVKEMPDAFRGDFCITHFFNPVRYMRLLEIVAGEHTRAEVIDALTQFCDINLGKGVVGCRDTPGFLGNRVGVFALQVGLIEAQAQGLSVEDADAIMGRPMGLPKTGLFGLYDLIGIDLMLDVVNSLQLPLPADDAFHDVACGIAAVGALAQRGDTGNKSGAGFYRTRTHNGEALREAVDLQTTQYRLARRPRPAAALAGEDHGLRALITHPDPGGRFAWRVLARTLSYAASLIPEISNTPMAIDEAMKLGYSWNQGPFEMIDELGPAWFRAQLIADGLPVPNILDAIGDGSFYRVDSTRIDDQGNGIVQFDSGAGYVPVTRAQGVVRLSDLKRTRQRLLGNEAASLWDIGDGVACLEFHSKANALLPQSMETLAQAIDFASTERRALLIHNDAAHFSVGFNLDFALACIRNKRWSALDDALRGFQSTCVACARASIPVIAAPSGLGLGGGFEVLLHCDALQVHSNITLGLVEPLVGLVPSGGGCKELLHRWSVHANDVDSAQQAAIVTFDLIAKARTAVSPAEAGPLRLMRCHDRVSMNRDRLLVDGKAFALELAKSYVPRATPQFIGLGDAGRATMETILQDFVDKGIAQAHDMTVSRQLAHVLCGGDAMRGATVTEQQMLDLERAAFITLAHTEQTRARIEHMLNSGRALRN